MSNILRAHFRRIRQKSWGQDLSTHSKDWGIVVAPFTRSLIIEHGRTLFSSRAWLYPFGVAISRYCWASPLVSYRQAASVANVPHQAAPPIITRNHEGISESICYTPYTIRRTLVSLPPPSLQSLALRSRGAAPHQRSEMVFEKIWRVVVKRRRNRPPDSTTQRRAKGIGLVLRRVVGVPSRKQVNSLTLRQRTCCGDRWTWFLGGDLYSASPPPRSWWVVYLVRVRECSWPGGFSETWLCCALCAMCYCMYGANLTTSREPRAVCLGSFGISFLYLAAFWRVEWSRENTASLKQQ